MRSRQERSPSPCSLQPRSPLAGCSTGDDDRAGGADAAACEPVRRHGRPDASRPGSPASKTSSTVWNEANPDIQVTVQTGPNGNGGTYQNFFNQLEAGNAPDLGQIEYDALPNFRVQDGLDGPRRLRRRRRRAGPVRRLDLGPGHLRRGGRPSTRSRRTPARWRCSTAPTSSRRTASRSPPRGRSTPTAAEQVRAAGGYITNFSQSDVNQFAGLRLAGRRQLVRATTATAGPST